MSILWHAIFPLCRPASSRLEERCLSSSVWRIDRWIRQTVPVWTCQRLASDVNRSNFSMLSDRSACRPDHLLCGCATDDRLTGEWQHQNSQSDDRLSQNWWFFNANRASAFLHDAKHNRRTWTRLYDEFLTNQYYCVDIMLYIAPFCSYVRSLLSYILCVTPRNSCKMGDSYLSNRLDSMHLHLL